MNVVPLRAEPLVSQQQLATHLACSDRHVRELTRRGCPCVKLGQRAIRYRISEVEAWLRREAA
jgi:phage terminase Nu1 subunit (DNA packaging protein)